MSRKVAVILMLSFFSLSMSVSNCLAGEIKKEEVALKEMLPGMDKIEPEKRILTAEEIANIKTILGGSLFVDKKTSKEAEEKVECTFNFGLKNGQRTNVAVVEGQKGKWGIIKCMVALDALSGRVTDVKILSHEEKRGRSIQGRGFLSRFIGKSSKDPIAIRTDIQAVSGATVSAEAVAFAVKKVVTIYEELYLKKQ